MNELRRLDEFGAKNVVRTHEWPTLEQVNSFPNLDKMKLSRIIVRKGSNPDNYPIAAI